MRYIDLSVQSIICLATLVAVLVSLPDPAWPLWVLLGQFILGGWQLSSGLLAVIFKTNFWRQKRRYLLVSVVYLFALTASNGIFGQTYQTAIAVATIVPAWAIAVYYYGLTWKKAFPKTNQSSFLPHLNF